VSEIEGIQEIFECWGSRAVKKASELLLKDVTSEMLMEPLRCLSQHQRDVLRPSLVSLSCEAVGGTAEDALHAAVAMVLEGYYLGLIDDVIDNAKVKLFRPTMLGQFGVDVTLIVSVIVDAKAHHALGELMGKLERDTYRDINRVFKDFLVRMIEGEALNVQVKKQGLVDPKDMIRVFEKHSADIEACTALGAIIGGASQRDVDSLAKYGRILGTMLLLNDDNRDAFNLTLELDDKILRGSYPYPLIWAANNTKDFKHFLQSLKKKKRINPKDVEKCVEYVFDSGAVTHVQSLMETMARDAVSTLKELKDNEAKKNLKIIAQSQPHRVLG
jgi:geranylgeranyl diphosphate synthase type I